MSSSAEETRKMTSDSLHNENCFYYLKALELPESVLQPPMSESLINGLKKIKSTEYDSKVGYADLYTQFFTEVEENIAAIFDNKRAELLHKQATLEGHRNFLKHNENTTGYEYLQKKAIEQLKLEEENKKKGTDIQSQLKNLDNFIFSIYDNENGILERTFEAIRHIPLSHTPIDAKIEKSISGVLKDDEDRINKTSQSPAQAGSAKGRFTAMISDDFKPQHTTSLATVRTYEYNEFSPVRELRFGTQGQRHHGIERVSLLFERWLEVQQRKDLEAQKRKALETQEPGTLEATEPELDESKITHIYFNNLGLDRTKATDFEGKKERALTQELHGLEKKETWHALEDTEGHSNIAVITLPADKGLMSQHDFEKTDDTHDSKEVFDEFLRIASQDPAATTPIKDFYISPKIRKILFKDPKTNGYTSDFEQEKLRALLSNSFKALGLKDSPTLTTAQRQAVWFHFIKFELTNYIIETLKPNSINFSCKDAIDRGGVSSAYYNLMKSFETKKPMSYEEFDRALHAAPTMVKARGMNHHLNVIWNTVDAYVNANYKDLRKNENKDKAWLIEWRDRNCPHERVASLLKDRIERSKAELNEALKEHPNKEGVIKKGLAILEQIEKQSDIGVSGKRLLLEAARRTPEITLNPTLENTKQYEEIADKLSIKYPKLQVLGGMMKAFAGLCLHIATAGYATKMMEAGIATAKAGFEAITRKEMQNKMKEQIHGFKTPEEIAKPTEEDDSILVQ